MKRRVPPAKPGEMPEHLRRFRHEDWGYTSLEEQIVCWRKWQDAGRAWLVEQGRDPKDYYELMRAARAPIDRSDVEPDGAA